MGRKKGSPLRKPVDRPADEGVPAPHQPSCFVGLGNQGATCYLNSLLQAFYLTPEFRAGLYALPSHEVASRKVLESLQRLFARLQLVDAHWLSTGRLTEAFNWGAEEATVQHDVQELTRILLDVLEKQLVGTSGAELVSTVFGGKLLYETTCGECGRVSSRNEPFYDLSVGIADTLLESLTAELGDEEFCGEDQYQCDGCNRKVDAIRRSRICKLPQVLTLSLKRFQYDQHTGRRSKIHKRCSFPMELDLGAFSQQSEPARYSCAAVVIHRGEAQSGHYHAFIKDSSGQGSWYQPTHAPGGVSVSQGDEDSDAPLAALMSLLEQCSRCRLAALSDQLTAHIGSSWGAIFADQFGTLEDFVTRHNDHFELIGPADNRLVQLRMPGGAADDDGWTHVGGGGAHAAENLQGASAESVLDEASGNWFDFDDVDVSPIVDSTIDSTFGGAEAAYMLLYRRIPEDGAPLDMAAFGEIPAALQDQVVAESVALCAARASSKEITALLLGMSATVQRGVLWSNMDDQPEPLRVRQQGGLCSVTDLRQAVAQWLGGGTQFELYSVKPVLFVDQCWHVARKLEVGNDAVSVDAVVVDVDGGLGDVLVGMENPLFLVRYFVLSADGCGSSKQLVVRQDTTLADLSRWLQEDTDIKQASQVLHVWRSSKKKGPPLLIPAQQTASRLEQIGLTHGSEFSIESKADTAAGGEPRASVEFARRRENLSLVVKLGQQTVQLHLPKLTTIEDVKQEALQQLVNGKHPIGCARLRQTASGGRFGLGWLLLDETTQLRNAALSDGAGLTLELEALPAEGSVAVQWYHRTAGWNYEQQAEGNSKRSDPFELIIDASCSLAELRRQMASSLGLNEKKVRLRRAFADEHGTPGMLLGNDDAIVGESMIMSNELLCLEDGAPVVKGLLSLRVHLLTGEVRKLQGSDSTVQSPGECNFVQTLLINESSSLAELRETLLAAEPFDAALRQLQQGAAGEMADVEDEWHDCADAELEFHDPHEAPSEPPPLRIQLYPSAQVLRSEGSALKDQPRAPVGHACSLAVSLLPRAERLSANNSALLHVALRSRSGVYGPTHSVTVDSGAAGALSSSVLMDALSEAFDIRPENLLLAKREAPPRWRVLRQQDKKKNKSKGGAKGVIQNLTKAPWNVGDGCFIGVKDLSKEPKQCEEDFFSQEDLALFPGLQRSDSSKSLNSLSGEVSLSINVAQDF